MLKKLSAVLTAIIAAGALMVPAAANAALMPPENHWSNGSSEAKEYQGFRYERCGDGIVIWSYSEDPDVLDIPAEIDGLPVTTIGCFAFAGKSMSKVNFPDSVTAICQQAFRYCKNLKSVKFPPNLNSICREAFSKSGLTSVVIPDSITFLGPAAFGGCDDLTKVDYSENVTFSGANPFTGTPWYLAMEKVTPIVIYKGILLNARVCDRESVTVPDGVRAICGNSFAMNELLHTLIIPDSVKEIGWGAAARNTGLKKVRLPKDLKVIPHDMFYCCPLLEDVEIPETVTEIGYRSFEGCSSLKKINIPDTVKDIYLGAFTGCSSLESAVVPDSVRTIDLQPDYEYGGEGGIGLTLGLFGDCTSLKSVKLPASIEKLCYACFFNCGELEEIEIPENVKELQFGFAQGCDKLKNVVIPESVESIQDYAFTQCESLETVTVKNPDCRIFDSSQVFSNAALRGYKGSTAEEYAEKYGLAFESIGEAAPIAMGDITKDGRVDASDASAVLVEYALLSTGGNATFTTRINSAADVNKDGFVNAADASDILMFYSYVSTGGTVTDMDEWLKIK